MNGWKDGWVDDSRPRCEESERKMVATDNHQHHVVWLPRNATERVAAMDSRGLARMRE